MLKRLFRRFLKQFSKSNTLGRISRRNITNMFTFWVYLSRARTWVLHWITQFLAHAGGYGTQSNRDCQTAGDVAGDVAVAVKWCYMQEWNKKALPARFLAFVESRTNVYRNYFLIYHTLWKTGVGGTHTLSLKGRNDIRVRIWKAELRNFNFDVESNSAIKSWWGVHTLCRYKWMLL
jgi:hypothetical protein